MPQFYLLSVLATTVAGLTLAGDYLGERIPALASFKNLRANRGGQIGVGIVSAVVGIFKLIIRSPGESVVFAGDLLPGLFGILLGVLLLAESFRKEVEARGESVDKIARTVLTYRVPLGIAGVITGLLHFLAPGVVIL